MKMDVTPFLQVEGTGRHVLNLMVEGVHCGGCVAKLERELGKVPGVLQARVNLTTRRMLLAFDPRVVQAPALLDVCEKLGYPARPYDPALLERADQTQERFLLLCMAVAGFASMNVMLLSVAMWAGATGQTLVLMQWISSLIVMPAVAFAGRPFFYSAWSVLKGGRVNMDVPISLAVILTTTLSLYDTIVRNGETYFESAAMLLFFLLVGRYLDLRARGKNRSAAEQLMELAAGTVRVLVKGKTVEMVQADLKEGMVMLVASGENLAADGVVLEGESTLDASMMTGESAPRAVKVGDHVQAGCVNLSGPLQVRITACGKGTVLAHLAQLVEEATSAKNAYTRLADKVSRHYAPVVHTLALATFMGWYFIVGVNLHTAVLHAAAVLIVTCPCAIALAVPAVQVALMGRLLRRGVIIKNAEALEKLKDIDTVVLDKTGTLTHGRFMLVSGGTAAQRTLAASVAAASRHPLSQALAMKDGVHACAVPLAGVVEVAGQGLEVRLKGQRVRLGSAAFCGVDTPAQVRTGETEVWLAEGKKPPVRFVLADTLREDAAAVVRLFMQAGMRVCMLSGDRSESVRRVAEAVGIVEWRAEVQPQEKYAFLQDLAVQGRRVLMCGDGINDAPSLAVAHVGLTFGAASDVAKVGADIILQNERLGDAFYVWKLARQGQRAVVGNFVISLAYNVVTVPIAMAGLMTPLGAAIAMSSSSLLVVGNALRLGWERKV